MATDHFLDNISVFSRFARHLKICFMMNQQVTEIPTLKMVEDGIICFKLLFFTLWNHGLVWQYLYQTVPLKMGFILYSVQLKTRSNFRNAVILINWYNGEPKIIALKTQPMWFKLRILMKGNLPIWTLTWCPALVTGSSIYATANFHGKRAGQNWLEENSGGRTAEQQRHIMNPVSLLHNLHSRAGISMHYIWKPFPLQASDIACWSLKNYYKEHHHLQHARWIRSDKGVFEKTEIDPEGEYRHDNKFRRNGGIRCNLSEFRTDWFTIQLKIYLTTQFIFS